ncbi:MAG: hypothetical protein AAFR27_11250, partial [Pseudomonadota bacterium]
MSAKGHMSLQRKKSGSIGMRSAVALCAIAASCAIFSAPTNLHAQSVDDLGLSADPNAQLLLQADDLIYDNDSGTVAASGDVRIEFDGNRLVADRVTYVEATGRLIAQGNVELLQ